MTDFFINNKRLKESKEQFRTDVIFGYTSTFFMLFLGILLFLKLNVLYFLPMVLSFLLMIITILNPNWINPIYIIVNKLFRFIGLIVLDFFLTVIYIILVLPVGIIFKLVNINKKHDDSLVVCENFVINYECKKSSIANLFSIFIRREYIMFLPLIIILLIIGIILVFAQTSYVAPFIYPLV